VARPATRPTIVWLSAWLALTITSTLLHRAAWLSPQGALPTIVIQQANNISHIMTLPGWVTVRIIGRGWRTGGWAYPVLANSVAWAMWLSAISLTLKGRRLALNWRSASCRAPLLPLTVHLPGPPAALGPPDSSRRRFLVTAPLALAGTSIAGSLLRATVIDPWDLRIARYTLPVRDLPLGLDRLGIVQISDTHLGPRIPAEFIEETIRRAIDLHPDLVMLTGDYIHAGISHIDLAARLFRPLLRLEVPVVGVLGNHDWYGDGVRMRLALERMGIAIIDNRREYLCARTRSLTQDPPASGIVLAGLADMLEDTIDPDAALAAAPRELPCLLLSHNPDAAELRCFQPGRTLPPRVDLMISGHTHGGQVCLPFLGTPIVPSRYGQKYAGGLVRGPAFPVLVSRGVGMSILPIRFGVPPEISEITLVRA
jgi:uncharacterized protein